MSLPAHFGADILLGILCLFALFATVKMTRWGFGLWDDLSAGANGITASLMFLFFSLANLFFAIAITSIFQMSFIDGHYQTIGLFWVIASFGLCILAAHLADKRMAKGDNNDVT